MIRCSGIADEAGQPIDAQIKAHKELGWDFIELRNIDGTNLTDVDDKTIRGATAAGLSLDEFTTPFRDGFYEDLATLRVERVEHYPAATEYIPQMVAVVEKLIEQGVIVEVK